MCSTSMGFIQRLEIERINLIFKESKSGFDFQTIYKPRAKPGLNLLDLDTTALAYSTLKQYYYFIL